MATNGTAAQALRRMAESEPELAARLIVHSLPAAAASLPPGLSYRLELEGLGSWTVNPLGDRAEVTEVAGDGDLNGEAFSISTDPATLAQVAAGRSPVGALARGRIKLRGRRRKALALRRLAPDAGPRDLARLGVPVDPDLVFRSLALRDRAGVDQGPQLHRRLRADRRWRRRLAGRGGRRAGPCRARARRVPRLRRPRALLGLAPAPLGGAHSLRRDEARLHRSGRPDLPGHAHGTVDRPCGGH